MNASRVVRTHAGDRYILFAGPLTPVTFAGKQNKAQPGLSPTAPCSEFSEEHKQPGVTLAVCMQLKDGSRMPHLQACETWGTSRCDSQSPMNFNRWFTLADKSIFLCRCRCYWVFGLCRWRNLFIVWSETPMRNYKQWHPTCVGRLMKENKLLFKREKLLFEIICGTCFLSRIKMLYSHERWHSNCHRHDY